MSDKPRGRVAVTLRETEAAILTLPNGDEVEVYVSRLEGGSGHEPRVRLSIEAPKEVGIRRRERSG